MSLTKETLDSAYRRARDAGLSSRDARALADRVAQRVVLGGETLTLAIDDELRKVK